MLDVDVRHRLGALDLAARFAATGPVTALFGPSGSGKTSLLNIIAGLIKADDARIALNGEEIAGNGHFLPAHKRRFGYVFQDARLFPHLNVRQNLLYGSWCVGHRPSAEEFGRIVDLLAIAPLLKRWPSSLSGGEKQRVAIGRALLAQPRLLLMDEPLASLDGERKDEILTHIERIKANTQIPIVYVSHSIPEVIRLASDIAVLEKGKLLAFGPLESMLARIGQERSGQERGALGEPMAVLDAEITGHDPAFGMARLQTRFGPLEVAGNALTIGQRVRIRIHASDVMIATRRPEAISAQNILPAAIAAIEPVPNSGGMRMDVRLVHGGAAIIARITARAVDDLQLTVGQHVFAVIKSVAIET